MAETTDGVYTGRLPGSLLHGSAKAAAIRELGGKDSISRGAPHTATP